MDQELQKLKQQWLLSQDANDALRFLMAAIQVNESVEISEFPSEVLQELFKNIDNLTAQVPNLTLYGQNLHDLLHNLRTRVEEDMAEAYQTYINSNHEPILRWARDAEHSEKQYAVVWSDFFRRLTIFVAFQEPLRDWNTYAAYVDVEDGKLDAHRLEKLEGPIGYLYQYRFHWDSALNVWPDTIEIFPEQEENLWSMNEQRLLNYLSSKDFRLTIGYGTSPYDLVILSNQIKPYSFPESPEINEDSCEDYPSCGHDICPPKLGGRQIAKVCSCGAYLSLNSLTSICESCLRGDDPKGPFEAQEDFDEGPESDENDDYLDDLDAAEEEF